MEFVLLLKLKIADRCRIWHIHHFIISEVQSQNHSCGLMKFLFCSRVLSRFLRVWISECVVQFYHAIFEMCGPRTGSHTGTRIDIRPCFGGWKAAHLCGLLVAIFLLKKERGGQLLHNIFQLQILFDF